MKSLAEVGDWPAFEEQWMDLLSEEVISTAPMLEVAEVAAAKDRRKVLLLLGLLAEELFDRGRNVEVEPVLRLALRLAPANEDSRSMVVRLLESQGEDSEFTAPILEFSEITRRAPVIEAWKVVDALMELRPGAYVQHRSWGVGKVVEMDVISEELVIDFIGRSGHTMKWKMGLQALDILEEDHILAHTVDRKKLLDAMKPVELLGVALRSIGGGAEVKQIRRLVEPVIPPGSWATWWQNARAQSKNEPRIRTTLARPVKFRWLNSEAEVQEENPLAELRRLPLQTLLPLATKIARDDSTRAEVIELVKAKMMAQTKGERLRFEALLLLDRLGDPAAKTMAKELLLSSERQMTLVFFPRSADLRRKAVELIEESFADDVGKLRAQLFLSANNPRDWELLVDRMEDEAKRELVWTVRRKLPDSAAAYFWLVRKGNEGYPFPYGKVERVTTLIDLLSQSSRLTNQIAAYIEETGVVQDAARDGGAERAGELKRLIREARQFPVSLRKEIEMAIDRMFPELEDRDEIIFTTEVGLEKRGNELKKLIREDLPENKANLAEATAHGDLRENAEYKAAKEQQERILVRLAEIEAEIAKTRILHPEKIDTSVVGPGCRVTLKRSSHKDRVVTILGPWDGDPDKDVLSYQAPGVQPLLGKATGDSVDLRLWGDSASYLIGLIESWMKAESSDVDGLE